MNNHQPEKTTRGVPLYQDSGETSRFTFAQIDHGGNLIMSTNDVGKTPQEWWGEREYEFSVTVKNDQKDKLLLAFITYLFNGKFSAVDEFRSFLQTNAIPHTFQNQP